MKKVFLLLILLSTISYLYAQKEKPAHPANGDEYIETIFSKPTKVRGYVGSTTNFTNINGETVVKFLRIGIGANYRFTLDVDQIENYNDDSFTDFGAFINLKFGWFN